MADAPRPAPPAPPPAPAARGAPMIGLAATTATLAWLGLVAWFLTGVEPSRAAAAREDPLTVALGLLAVVLPVALIWLAAWVARTARALRVEAARLHAAIEAVRRGYVESQEAGSAALRRTVEERLAGVLRAQTALGAEVAALQAERDAPDEPALRPPTPRPEAVPAPQAALALSLDERVDESEPLPAEDFVRALNFPENDRDSAGFAVLRRALRHRKTARLVEASQALLTLLAQDGIYVDDLSPHRAPPAAWRAFAEGARGTEVAALAGVRDRSSLALTAGRMRDDPVFRDAVHRFLSDFDAVFQEFAEDATDAEIVAFADTRTARAFMLAGKVAGTLDR